jgi:hypothetical protein
MQGELLRHHGNSVRPVGVFEDEGIVGVLGDDAHRGSQLPAQIERIEREPLAAPLGRVESVDEKPLRGGLRSCRRADRRKEQRGEKNRGSAHGLGTDARVRVRPKAKEKGPAIALDHTPAKTR